MKKIAFIITLVVAGCATERAFVDSMNAHVGSSVESIVSQLGPPDSEYKLPGGGKVMTYTHARNIQTGGYTQYVPDQTTTTGMIGNTPYTAQSNGLRAVQTPVYNIELSCTVNFTIDSEGIMRRWASRGNNCVN